MLLVVLLNISDGDRMILAIENCFKIFTFYKSNFSSINFEIFSNFERTLLQIIKWAP
jgi:hypothetical protein